MLTAQHMWHLILNDTAYGGRPGVIAQSSISHAGVSLKAARTREGGSRSVRDN